MLQLGIQSGKNGQTLKNSEVAKAKQEDLEFLKALFEDGKIVSIIDQEFPLREAADAVRHLERGHARGKIIVNIENDNEN